MFADKTKLFGEFQIEAVNTSRKIPPYNKNDDIYIHIHINIRIYKVRILRATDVSTE